MSNISFTCPHCSYRTSLASSTVGMKGNCPSCKTEVVITPDASESESLVMSSGLKTASNHNLVSCKDCGSMVSRNAVACPQCGTPNPSDAKGTLIIARNQRFLFFAAKMNVWHDGSVVATQKNGEAIHINLIVGKHKIRIGPKNFSHQKLEQNEVIVNIQANKVTKVEFDATMDRQKLNYLIIKPT